MKRKVTVVVILIGALISSINRANSQIDTNFYEFRNYFYQGYQGEIDTNEGSTLNQFAKFEYIYGPKFSPTGSVQKAGEAIDAWVEHFQQNGLGESDLVADWQSMGPNLPPHHGLNYIGKAEGVGRLICIEFDPIDPANIIYVGSPFGGLWKTMDGGQNWFNLNTDLQLPIIGISCIAINPENPNMIFIATGNRDDYHNASISAGVYRSIDGGQIWSPVNNGLNFAGFYQFSKILINPLNPDEIYLSTSKGIYKTSNGTSDCTWNLLTDPLVNNKYFRNILYKPDGLYTTIYASGTDIIKSTNGGMTWVSMTGPGTGLEYSQLLYPYPVRINIAVTDANPDLIYASALVSNTNVQFQWNSNRKHYIFRYDGSSWLIRQFIPGNTQTGYKYSSHGFEPSWLAIDVSPIDPDIIYFGNVITRKWKFNDLEPDIVHVYHGSDVHPDIHELRFSPDGEKLYILCDGGIFKLTNPYYNNSEYEGPGFVDINKGLAIGTIQKIGGFEMNQNLMLVGEFDVGSNIYAPEILPQENPWQCVSGGDGCEQTIIDNQTAFLSTQKNDIYKSTGNYFPFDYLNLGRPESQNAEFCSDFFVNPFNKCELFLNYQELFKLTYFNGNNEYYFDPVSYFKDDFTLSEDRVLTAIGYSSNKSNYIYTSMINYGMPVLPVFTIFKTITGGYNSQCTENCWSQLVPPNAHYITGIAVSPYDENKIWISYSGYDKVNKVKYFNGIEWSDFSSGLPNLPVNNLVFLNGSIDGLFAACDVGIYYRDATMEDWQPFMDNLPNVMVTDLEINYSNNFIRAGTYGRGLWESPLPCYTTSQQLLVSNDQTWSTPMRFNSDVVVKSGVTLTISDKATLYFLEGKKIIVERGGKLEIDGATCTNSCGASWHGIEVWGTINQQQLATQQGWVKIINSGKIENSRMGIYTNRSDPESEGQWLPGYTGGIIQADDATFLNNKIAVQFFSYPFSSVSHFTDCQFITNDDYQISELPDYFMVVQSMNNVQVVNCDFLNEGMRPQNGIRSYSSKLYVDGKCTGGQPCTTWDNGKFENLNYGINATDNYGLRYVDIRHNDFINNFRSLYIGGISNARVTSNYFEINTPFTTEGGYGLYLDNSSGFWVEDNDFKHINKPETGVGIIADSSGTQANEIYRNRFINLTLGISAQELNAHASGNPGLQILCNDFDECVADILVPVPASTHHGVAYYQGSDSQNPADMAGNLFCIPNPNPVDYDDINNQGRSINYYYPSNTDWTDTRPIDYTQSTVFIHGKTTSFTWIPEVGCPSHIETGGSSGTEQLLGQISQAKQNIDSIQTILADRIDGGSTSNLVTTVDNSLPPESQEVYNDLINTSPYLSDTVVSAAIEKEDVLPGVMIRDVMVANPHTARNDELIEKLDERWTPLPEYMKQQILQARNNVSERERTESCLAGYRLQKTRAFSHLARHYSGDTLNPEGNTDSLALLLGNDHEPDSKYRLAFLKLEQGAISSGQNILSAISIQFDLNAYDQTEHENMTDFYDLLAEIGDQEPDSLQITGLIDIMEREDGRASIYARNILMNLGVVDYEEPIELPGFMKSAGAAGGNLTSIVIPPKDASLVVKPNPARDFVTVEYRMGKPCEATVKVTDVSGISVFSEMVTETENQFIISTKGWRPGNYFVTLNSGGKTLAQAKLTITE